MSKHWLESAYWASQVIVMVIAIAAAIGVYRAASVARQQLKSYKLFELMKFIEESEFRIARRIVVLEIEPLNNTKWWEEEDREKVDRLEWAAGLVCARYDILGLMIEFDKFDRKDPNSTGDFLHATGQIAWLELIKPWIAI
jgi:hypothetical protein